MTGGIFISYRRDDANHAAGRLLDRLSRNIPNDQLFFDIDNIEPGLDFKKVLSEKVQSCDVLLAVIGPRWLGATDKNGARRLDDPKDFVRIELEAALARDIRVIPVLVDGAQIPGEGELPASLQSLAFRNAVRLTHERFAADAEDLAKALSRAVAPVSAVQTPQTGQDRAFTGPMAVPNEVTTKQSPVRGPQAGPKVAAIVFSICALVAPFVLMPMFKDAGWTWFGPEFGNVVGTEMTVIFLLAFLGPVAAYLLASRRGSSLTGVEAALYWLPAAALISFAVVPVVCLATGDAAVPYNRRMIGVGFGLGAAFFVLSGITMLWWWRRSHR